MRRCQEPLAQGQCLARKPEFLAAARLREAAAVKLRGLWRVYWSVPTTFLRLVRAVVLLLPVAVAAKPDPVNWSAAVRERQADGTIVLEVTARIERGWYIYGMRQPEDGPAPLRFRGASGSGVAVGPVRTPMPRVSYDRGFAPASVNITTRRRSSCP